MDAIERKRLWRINNPEKYKAQVERHNKTENHRNNVRKYKRKNSKKLSETNKRVYWKNPEKARERAKIYRLKNKDKISSRNYANKHKLLLGIKCEICSSKNKLVKHHINYSKQEIITVCCRCNNQIRFYGLEGKSLDVLKEVYNNTNWE